MPVVVSSCESWYDLIKRATNLNLTEDTNKMTLALIVVEMLVFACACWMVFFLSLFAHELGHAVVYMLITGNIHTSWHLRVGSGKSLLKTKHFSIKLAVFDGVFEPEEDRMESKTAILTLLGGPLFSLILVGILLYTRLNIATFDSVIISSEAIPFSQICLYPSIQVICYLLSLPFIIVGARQKAWNLIFCGLLI